MSNKEDVKSTVSFGCMSTPRRSKRIASIREESSKKAVREKPKNELLLRVVPFTEHLLSELEIDSWLLAPDSLASLLRLDEELSDESIEAREVD